MFQFVFNVYIFFILFRDKKKIFKILFEDVKSIGNNNLQWKMSVKNSPKKKVKEHKTKMS